MTALLVRRHRRLGLLPRRARARRAAPAPRLLPARQRHLLCPLMVSWPTAARSTTPGLPRWRAWRATSLPTISGVTASTGAFAAVCHHSSIPSRPVTVPHNPAVQRLCRLLSTRAHHPGRRTHDPLVGLLHSRSHRQIAIRNGSLSHWAPTTSGSSSRKERTPAHDSVNSAVSRCHKRALRSIA